MAVELSVVFRTPYCDCHELPSRKRSPWYGMGFRKRDDGMWVRTCCDRPEKQRWERLVKEGV